jgi:hypothetical protein
MNSKIMTKAKIPSLPTWKASLRPLCLRSPGPRTFFASLAVCLFLRVVLDRVEAGCVTPGPVEKTRSIWSKLSGWTEHLGSGL